MASSDLRAALVRAALDLQFESGLDEPSILAICQRAGCARATFYEHFTDREALISATLDELIGSLADVVLDDQQPGDVAAIVQRFMTAMMTGNPTITGTSAWAFRDTLALLGKNPRIRLAYVARLSDLQKRLEAKMLLGQRAGRIRADLEPSVVAGLLVGLAYGALALLDVGAEVDFAGIANGFVRSMATA